ncbi:MAG: hypothetical protein JXQ27_12175, partial [Acidobacteria bacterium]|nr:hypothetical protein [Acidobacteriota bacterium]
SLAGAWMEEKNGTRIEWLGVDEEWDTDRTDRTDENGSDRTAGISSYRQFPIIRWALYANIVFRKGTLDSRPGQFRLLSAQISLHGNEMKKNHRAGNFR